VVFLIDCRVFLNFVYAFDPFFLFTEGKQHFFNLRLVVIYVGIDGDVVDYVPLQLERVDRLSFGVGDEGFNFWL
jgi:hypothetical protein